MRKLYTVNWPIAAAVSRKSCCIYCCICCCTIHQLLSPLMMSMMRHVLSCHDSFSCSHMCAHAGPSAPCTEPEQLPEHHHHITLRHAVALFARTHMCAYGTLRSIDAAPRCSLAMQPRDVYRYTGQLCSSLELPGCILQLLKPELRQERIEGFFLSIPLQSKPISSAHLAVYARCPLHTCSPAELGPVCDCGHHSVVFCTLSRPVQPYE